MSDPYGSNPYGQNPYGQNPPPPPNAYGAPHGGHGELPPKTDGVSVASLVLSLLCCTGLIGLILGFVGLRRTKGGQRKGRGFAIAGIVLGLVGVVTVAVLSVVGVSFFKSIVTPDNAEVGQCVDIDENDDTLLLRDKDCAEKHDGEIVYVGEWREVSAPPAGVTTDEEAQKAVCTALVGKKAASFPKDLEWNVAFNEDDAENPGPSAPFICYVESDSGLDGSLL